MSRSKWEKLAEDKDGHRLFRRALPPGERDNGNAIRLFVADRSGQNPDLTDDARKVGKPTEIAYPLDCVILEPSYGFLVANLPITDGTEAASFRISLSCKCAVEVAALWRLPLFVRDSGSSLLYPIGRSEL